MESIDYEGWTIRTQFAGKGFGAVMTDPNGNVFHQSTISWQSHRSARRYAQKFIDWYIKLEARQQNRDSSIERYEAL